MRPLPTTHWTLGLTRGVLELDGPPWLELHWIDLGHRAAWWWTTAEGVVLGAVVAGEA